VIDGYRLLPGYIIAQLAAAVLNKNDKVKLDLFARIFRIQMSQALGAATLPGSGGNRLG
jgi:hypothetical protein